MGLAGDSGWGKVCLLLPKAAISALAFLMLGWFAFGAYLNVAVPTAITSGATAHAEGMLPRWSYRYHALVGAAYAKREEWRKAEVELVLASSGYLDPILWNNLAHVYAKTGRWPMAAEVYERWARSGLDHLQALSNLSVAYEQSGNIADAVQTLQARAKLFPRLSREDIQRLVVMQFQSGEYPVAEETLTHYSRILYRSSNQEQSEVDNLMGAILLSQGKSGDARWWFQAALKKNPSLESARRNLEELERSSEMQSIR